MGIVEPCNKERKGGPIVKYASLLLGISPNLSKLLHSLLLLYPGDQNGQREVSGLTDGGKSCLGVQKRDGEIRKDLDPYQACLTPPCWQEGLVGVAECKNLTDVIADWLLGDKIERCLKMDGAKGLGRANTPAMRKMKSVGSCELCVPFSHSRQTVNVYQGDIQTSLTDDPALKEKTKTTSRPLPVTTHSTTSTKQLTSKNEPLKSGKTVRFLDDPVQKSHQFLAYPPIQQTNQVASTSSTAQNSRISSPQKSIASTVNAVKAEGTSAQEPKKPSVPPQLAIMGSSSHLHSHGQKTENRPSSHEQKNVNRPSFHEQKNVDRPSDLHAAVTKDGDSKTQPLNSIAPPTSKSRKARESDELMVQYLIKMSFLYAQRLQLEDKRFCKYLLKLVQQNLQLHNTATDIAKEIPEQSSLQAALLTLQKDLIKHLHYYPTPLPPGERLAPPPSKYAPSYQIRLVLWGWVWVWIWRWVWIWEWVWGRLQLLGLPLLGGLAALSSMKKSKTSKKNTSDNDSKKDKNDDDMKDEYKDDKYDGWDGKGKEDKKNKVTDVREGGSVEDWASAGPSTEEGWNQDNGTLLKASSNYSTEENGQKMKGDLQMDTMATKEDNYSFSYLTTPVSPASLDQEEEAHSGDFTPVWDQSDGLQGVHQSPFSSMWQ
ncbi:hypothetical protein BJ684DRAFT_14749 [Piptocephalis cylindrospora]|uniref:Uncharacterized protein n=1 Tax=Piptocephalis cylindrospora TaxID=1907219 RepID=A0A4P9Y849_9FUNG|nr:hypothetical protein BJ684DRAFT_14749 [Piptocephalis cylindrospora]|eukprot:RKP14954.1 hypothetical protein BJ684DRAFT_14749 [Piptocephalis cylindrospora]